MRPIPLLLILSALALPALSQAAVRVAGIAKPAAQPVGMAFLPDDQGILITLRGGELKRWQPGKGLSAPIAGVPQVWANGEGGLLDVALAPDFAQSRRVWLSYAESDASGKAGTAVGYGRSVRMPTSSPNFTVVFRQQPKLSVGNHFGGRLVFFYGSYPSIGLGENNQRATARI